MLMPKRVKYRKPHRPPLRGMARRGANVAFGDYGLQALENVWLTARQIEAARIAITRRLRKGGRMWIRVFPDVAYTKKPLETRMGKGKGTPELWVAPVKRGRVLFEVAGISKELVEEAFRAASCKLPIKVRVICREGMGGE
ncbi:50S ribosomal protein L16 [Acetomicrobium sp. S15 = DSM 107314]|jgi:large subunit ribosomal protein L16|uniref:50S ribosomal protein L16 n=1 Tax=Acetomicrobium sp. S15 = DSM 107314 TaxID=2529858 RepID=UPI0018E157D0|nr:50S ribosomal protein L16 [Acetomicrobium sp. S15 = DSM 107314]